LKLNPENTPNIYRSLWQGVRLEIKRQTDLITPMCYMTDVNPSDINDEVDIYTCLQNKRTFCDWLVSMSPT